METLILMQQILTEACRHGRKDVVQLLLEQSGGNIDFNATNNYGTTALMKACWNGHKDVVLLLLEQSGGNIDFNAVNDFGTTAFIEACDFEHKDVVKLLLEYAKAKGIQIPSSQSFLLNNISKEIKTLIDDFQEEK